MATTYHTVSDEVAWTDWSVGEDRARPVRSDKKRSVFGITLAFLVAGAMLAGVIYLVPPGSY